eukprot:jgi/Tetstr1/434280/TSEL_023387.t1
MGMVHILANLTSRSAPHDRATEAVLILGTNDISILATVIVPYKPDRSWHFCLSEMASEAVVFPPYSPDLFAPGRLGVRDDVGPPKWPVVPFRLPLRARCPAPAS